MFGRTAITEPASIPQAAKPSAFFPGLLTLALVLVLAGCVPSTPVSSPSTPPSTPTTLPGLLTVQGTVTDVMLSARVILVETEQGPVDVPLTEKTRILGPDGTPIPLRDIRPGYVIEATGRPGTEKSVIPEEVRVLKAASKPAPPSDAPQGEMPPTPGPIPMTTTVWTRVTFNDLGVSLEIPQGWNVQRHPGEYFIAPPGRPPWLVVGLKDAPTDLSDLSAYVLKEAQAQGESNVIVRPILVGEEKGIVVWGETSVCADVYVPVQGHVTHMTFMRQFCTSQGDLNNVAKHILDSWEWVSTP